MTFPYDVAIGPASGSTPTQALTFFDSWTLDGNLDDGCSFSFSLPGDTLPGTQIIELSTDVWLYFEGNLIDRFRVMEVTQSWDSDGKTTKNVECVCYRRLLASRFTNVDLTYTAVSQGQIVWNLIQHTQALTNGNLGITLGSVGPFIARNRAYLRGTNILDAIVELTQIENGLTWEIDGNLQLWVSQADAYPQVVQPIQLGANALVLEKPSGAATFGNVAVVSGDTQSTTTQITEALGLATDIRGRWERFYSIPQERSQTNLIQTSTGLVEQAISPTTIWRVVLDPQRFLLDSHYELGDRVVVVQPAVVVPSASDPTIPLLTVPAATFLTQVANRTVTVTADGQLSVEMRLITAYQRWDDVPVATRWDDLPLSLTWDALSNQQIT